MGWNAARCDGMEERTYINAFLRDESEGQKETLVDGMDDGKS